ncbi:MAG: universal stress protein [Geminicoccaceae bacterium]|nr:universal stress protein [Geminicoccaceae bacterium]MDW8340675.1 universal stress protein [Geminicoccaceae bacterium]
MKTILAHLETGPGLDSVLRCALLVARRFGSHIEGLHLRPGQPDVIAAGADGFVAAAPDLLAGFEREARERAERARRAFEAFVAAEGLPPPGESAGGPSARMRIEQAGQLALGSIGRVFDLIVVGRPQRDSPTPSMAALEAALFESGRLLLVAPPAPPEALGAHVVVAWNQSTETARTVALSMPFLASARKVTVLTVTGATVPGPTGEELAENLRRHGFDCTAVERDPRGRPSGQAMLEEAAALGGDLLVKGAYTQSRLRQMIFGGATSHILAHAELPVLMAH